MYNAKFICTYNTDEIFEPTDELTEYDKEFVRNVIYRQELLNIFCLDEYNDVKMDDSFHDLYENIKYYEPLKPIFVKLAEEVISEDIEVGMIILFSYDFMYQSHKCFSELIETNKISDENLDLLKKLINYSD